jgi:hypothetical protein
MTRRIALAAGLLALAAAAPCLADDGPGAVVHRKLASYGPWYTPAQAAFIRTRCGYGPGAAIRDLRIEGDVMTCGNGRRVRDPQVRAMARDVTRRAQARARAVMADPEVRDALASATSGAAHRALADAEARLAQVPR